MDKNIVLPLETDSLSPEHIAGAMNLNRDFASGYIKGEVEQRDADFERILPLMEAISHGLQYEGPTYTKEREAIKLALAVLLGGQEVTS